MPCRSVNPFQAKIYDREEGCADWGGNAGFSPKMCRGCHEMATRPPFWQFRLILGLRSREKGDEIGQKGMSCSLDVSACFTGTYDNHGFQKGRRFYPPPHCSNPLPHKDLRQMSRKSLTIRDTRTPGPTSTMLAGCLGCWVPHSRVPWNDPICLDRAGNRHNPCRPHYRHNRTHPYNRPDPTGR